MCFWRSDRKEGYQQEYTGGVKLVQADKLGYQEEGLLLTFCMGKTKTRLILCKDRFPPLNPPIPHISLSRTE
jgi:hypothetical protein